MVGGWWWWWWCSEERENSALACSSYSHLSSFFDSLPFFSLLPHSLPPSHFHPIPLSSFLFASPQLHAPPPPTSQRYSPLRPRSLSRQLTTITPLLYSGGFRYLPLFSLSPSVPHITSTLLWYAANAAPNVCSALIILSFSLLARTDVITLTCLFYE